MPPTSSRLGPLDGLLAESKLTPAHELPQLLARHAEALGGAQALLYLADLQQQTLVPFRGRSQPPGQLPADALSVDGSMAGRAFRHYEVLSHDLRPRVLGQQVWIPVVAGSERIGVLSLVVQPADDSAQALGEVLAPLHRFAELLAELVVVKALHGDEIVRARRTQRMGLAAEMQWALLPPLTFASTEVVVAGALEPAYEVAGDSLDYAVDASTARFAIFDGMGHGLRSAQLATLSVAAYRQARRSGKTLSQSATEVDEVVDAAFGGEAFTTAVLAELDTSTGDLTWVSAGHPAPLLFREGRLVRDLEVSPGQPFGMDLSHDVGRYPVGSERLQPGDCVLLYTDGVTEARAPGGDFFGVPALTELLEHHFAAELPAPETLRRVISALLEHEQGRLQDDATLLLVEWRSGNEQRLLP